MTDTARQRLNEKIIQQFRSGGGRVGGQFADTPLLLLTTLGARTGVSRTWPLAYQQDGERVVVFAANGGRGTRPGWFHNLLANPAATIEVGTESWPVTAQIVTGDERAELWQRQLVASPFLADFQAKLDWEIPVVALTPAVTSA
ncbi:nitroreductase family deazaflavin-dependent oxidoreductase [Nocardia sp. ET3-3]|uniref:Nitroreductase family deazaflavin-dependent oxidoreductase n=1 Tax=Nocardia terrae TaxID=2675851 RepID=A0A7K1UW81_9NOCA|nr:nitroreductase/quinone reductase family protein [Nocardia terrae]MVU78567.1 nitroreductase family deazaflavin-dependent oxidoreductase [Nocardia terrae]